MQALELQPLKITISGAYYDSQIYDGRLFLWKADGSILVLDWDNLVDSVAIDEKLKTVFNLTFKYGAKLYKNLLLEDTEIKILVMEKLQKLSRVAIDISEKYLTNFVVSLQDNPFPFPHADSSIHYKNIYVGSQSGVSRSRCSYSREIALNPQTEKLWDAPVLSLTASNKTLAIAAGSEGLFDYFVGENYSENHAEPRNITKKHSNFARWMYPGIFSSSYFNEGHFADFKENKESKFKSRALKSDDQVIHTNLFLPFPDNSTDLSLALPDNSSAKKPLREFTRLFSSHEIFPVTKATNKLPRFTWGARDKICLVTENSIELVRCFPREKKEAKKFESLGSTEVEDLTGDIVSADSSFFGIVLEEEDSLLVINSLLQHKRFSGEPVNWRVFPDSVNYVNQLHIIYEDFIQIYLFTHDYFLNQKDKIIGMSFGTE